MVADETALAEGRGRTGNAFARDRFTWLAYTSLGFYSFYQCILGPVMPSLRDELGINYTVASLHFSAFALGMIAAGALSDRLARRFGRPLVVWSGLLLMSLGSLIFALGGHATLTIFSTFAMGLFGTVSAGSLLAALSYHHGGLHAVALTEATAFQGGFVLLTPLLVGVSQQAELGWRGTLFSVTAAFVLFTLLCHRTAMPRAKLPFRAGTTTSLPRAFYWSLVTLFFVASGLATVGWTDGDLVPEVHAKEKKCPEPDRRTRRSSAARRSGWFGLRTRSTPYPG